MGRPRIPADSLGFAYVQGPPKRIVAVLRKADGTRTVADLSTRDARSGAAILLRAIDTAEADKIATRGDATQIKRLPKRDGSRGLTKRRAIRPPSRLQRVENAAINLRSALDDLRTRLPPDARRVIAEASAELDQALTKRPAKAKKAEGPAR